MPTQMTAEDRRADPGGDEARPGDVRAAAGRRPRPQPAPRLEPARPAEQPAGRGRSRRRRILRSRRREQGLMIRRRLPLQGPRRILCGVAGSIDGRAGLLRTAGHCSAARTTPRSRPPIAGSPRNAIPTATTAAAIRKRSSRRSAKPMTSSRTRRSAPPMTASARPRSRMAAAAIRSARPASTAFPTSSRPSSASSWTRAAQRQNAARGADLRYDLELTLEEAFAGVEKTITVEALAHVRRLPGRGCTQAERCAQTCQTCGGMGKVRAQQGFFVVERGCPTCRGSRRGDRRPVRAIATARAGRSTSASCR